VAGLTLGAGKGEARTGESLPVRVKIEVHDGRMSDDPAGESPGANQNSRPS